MDAFVDDLEFAQTTGVCVEVYLLSGEKFFAGVHEVSENEGFVALYSPRHMQDETTTRKIALDLIGSVTVTNTRWRSD